MATVTPRYTNSHPVNTQQSDRKMSDICFTFIKIIVINSSCMQALTIGTWQAGNKMCLESLGWGVGKREGGGCTVLSMAHVISRQHGSQVNTHVMTASSDLENTGCFERKPTISRLRFKSVYWLFGMRFSVVFTQSFQASAANCNVKGAAATACCHILLITHRSFNHVTLYIWCHWQPC